MLSPKNDDENEAERKFLFHAAIYGSVDAMQGRSCGVVRVNECVHVDTEHE